MKMLYKKPFIVALVFFIIGAVTIYFGNAMVSNDDSDGFGLFFLGGFAILIALITALVYLAMNVKFSSVLRNPLLQYEVSTSALNQSAQEQIKELKSKNKTILGIMLFFCLLIAVVSPFIVEEPGIMIIICIGIAVFMTLAALITTSYRVHKLKRGSNYIVVAREGAYVNGEFHCWKFPNYLGQCLFTARDNYNYLEITYYSINNAGPLDHLVLIPVPPEQYYQVLEILPVLQGMQHMAPPQQPQV